MPSEQQKTSCFLPDFCNVRTLFMVILLGELLAFFLALANSINISQRFTDLALYSLFIQWTILSCATALCLFKDYLSRLPEFLLVSISYFLTLFISFIIIELVWWAYYTRVDLAYTEVISHGEFLFQCLGISVIFSGLILRYFYVRHQWQNQIGLEAIARLQALQSRIRPHFFFNCMNTIASLTRSDPKLAEEALEDMTDIFRAYLQESDRAWTVSEEVVLCRHYLRIESHRLGDRLQVIWDIDCLPENAAFPALMLQPIIENAIYYGIEPLVEAGVINISGQFTEDKITITIRNPLCSDQLAKYQSGNQMAHENIRQRLAVYYEQEGMLLTECDAQEYTTKIIVPYIGDS